MERKITLLLLLNTAYFSGQNVNFKVNSACISYQNINYIVGITDVRLSYPVTFSKLEEVAETTELTNENEYLRVANQNYSFYPNPVIDRLYIVLSDVKTATSIMVYNMVGQIVAQRFMNTGFIDLSMLQKGMYLVTSGSSLFTPFKILKN